jgi:hypothetical protein
MKVINFEVKKANQRKGVKGVLVQFDTGEGQITFEHMLDSTTEKSYSISPDGEIQSPGNFIASFVHRIAPDTYRNVAIDGKNTKILHSYDVVEKKTRTIYRVGGHDFSDIEQTVTDLHGNKVALRDVFSFEEIQVPVDYEYTKNLVLNRILSDNNVPYDIDRNFIRVLNASMYLIRNAIVSRNEKELIIAISKFGKKGFSIMKSFPDKAPSIYLYLRVKLAHFQ